MAFAHGKSAGFAISSSSQSGYVNISAFTDSVDWNDTLDTDESTVFQSSDFRKTYVIGNGDGTVSVGGKWDLTLDGYFEAIKGRATRCYHFPASTDATVAGFRKRQVNAILTSYNTPSDVGGANVWSADFQMNGVVTSSTST